MSPRHRHERGLRRGYRREVGCDLRARRGGLRGRAARDRASPSPRGRSGTRPGTTSSSRTCPATSRRKYTPGGGAEEVDEPVEQVQRAHLRRRPQPARLRARHELARPRAARRDARDDREPLRGQGAEQPERRRASTRAARSLLRPVVRPHARLRRGARARARLPGRLPARGRRRARAPRRPRRLRAAERPLLLARRVAPLHQRHAAGAYIEVYDVGRRRRGRRTAACSSRGSAPASSRRASPTG